VTSVPDECGGRAQSPVDWFAFVGVAAITGTRMGADGPRRDDHVHAPVFPALAVRCRDTRLRASTLPASR